MLTLDSPAFQELRRDFNEWLPSIIEGRDRFVAAHESLADTPPVALRQPIGRIMAAVAKQAGCRLADICGPRRSRVYAHPRFIGYLLASETVPEATLPQIGQAFGKRDHTTILHGIKIAKKLIAESPEWREFYESVKGGL